MSKRVDGIVSQRVRELRELRGWSQDDLAARMEAIGHQMQRSTIGKIERGGRAVTPGELLALAAALDCAPVRLMVAEGERLEVTANISLDERSAAAWISGRGGPVAPDGDYLVYAATLPSWDKGIMRNQSLYASGVTEAGWSSERTASGEQPGVYNPSNEPDEIMRPGPVHGGIGDRRTGGRVDRG